MSDDILDEMTYVVLRPGTPFLLGVTHKSASPAAAKFASSIGSRISGAGKLETVAIGRASSSCLTSNLIAGTESGF
jgi:hypothetical protein